MPTARTLNREIATSLIASLLTRDGWRFDAVTARGWCGNRQLRFFFAGQRNLTHAFRRIADADTERYESLGVLVVADGEELRRVREDRLANRYPRAFFVSLEELQALADGTPILQAHRPGNILDFNAEIVANRPIGAPGSSHYVLTFRAPLIQDVWPSQFIMMDVTPSRPLTRGRAVRPAHWHDALDAPPLPTLKRPFGIQRAYYRHFDKLFLKHLALPATLGVALHMVHPYQFDMLYKVLPGGSGTALLPRLKPRDRVHMVGPLGSPYDVRVLRTQGVREVHAIGGGVGVAPLILMVQALRYYAFPVKVFIGISSLELLRYTGHVASSFAEGPGDAYVYVDDLLEAGLKPQDIFLSSDTPLPKRAVRGIPKANLFHGLVPEQYRQFIAQGKRDCVAAFTCGPNPMMEAVYNVTRPAGIALKVLMEKRMGCGFGVCLSCVCKVRHADGHVDYARVCTEGPVFDAGEIVWNNNDSKPSSATCGCARPS